MRHLLLAFLFIIIRQYMITGAAKTRAHLSALGTEVSQTTVPLLLA